MRLRMALAGAFVGGALVAGVAAGAVQILDNGGSSGTPASGGAPAATTVPGDKSQQLALAGDCQSAADIYKSVRPAVVEITSTLGSGGRFGQARGTGSGVVIDEQGHILTNNHVIDGATSIEVRFADGGTTKGTVSGTDAADDMAVVQVDPSAHKLTVVKLGDSSALNVGDPVLAIGSPFNLEGSLTQGIVSGLDRTHGVGENARPVRHMIQTDAAVNPGNSGGPLLDCRGEVIGINTLLENPTGQDVNVGVAFAVSINTAKQSMSSMVAGTPVQHPWLGIAGADVTPGVANDLGLNVQSGVYVTVVSSNSPASEAGLKAAFSSASAADNSSQLPPGGDVITAADGQTMTSIDQLASYLDENKKPGDTVKLTVMRDGKEISVDAQLAEWPSQAPAG
jgi:S1-C subfamily serine protease